VTGRRRPSRMTLTRPGLAFVGVLTLVALTGCGSSGAASESSAGGNAADHAAAAPSAGRAGVANTGNGGDVAQAADTGPKLEQKAIIRNGDIAIRTMDPQQARDSVDGLLTRLDGSVDGDQTVYDKQGHIHDAQLVLRVPVASFTTAMDDLARLGTVVHSSSTGRDVTTQVIDVQQRLKTLRISLHDLNAFQAKASNIGQLLRFENAITQRRGEYQSLKAQRNHLVNETSMSTINLDISVPPMHAAVTTHHRHAGFVTGLRHGWSALTRSVVVALTGVGAALPFAVLLAVIGLPLLWWTRRGRHLPSAATPADSPPVD
jgi:hypothetical protein